MEKKAERMLKAIQKSDVIKELRKETSKLLPNYDYTRLDEILKDPDFLQKSFKRSQAFISDHLMQLTSALMNAALNPEKPNVKAAEVLLKLAGLQVERFEDVTRKDVEILEDLSDEEIDERLASK